MVDIFEGVRITNSKDLGLFSKNFPGQVDGVDVLENVLENGIILGPARVGDDGEAVEAPADDRQAYLEVGMR